MKLVLSLRSLRVVFILCSLVLLYTGGVSVRRTVLEAQRIMIGEDLPFTLESALHFRRVKILFDRGFLPEVDQAIQYPEGIRIREIDAVTAEPVQAFFARWFPEPIPFADRIRWIETGWFCLGIPLLVLALRLWTGSWWAGFAGAAVWAVSIAAVLRSTGQEIARENFALPWLIAAGVCTFGFWHSGHARMPNALKPAPVLERIPQTVWLVLASCMMALALIGWDMIQYVIGLMTLGMSVHVLGRRALIDTRLITLFAWFTGTVLLVSLLHPYYRFHGLALSPLMIWMLSVAAVSLFIRSRAAVQPSRLGLFVGVVGPLLIVLALGLTGVYGDAYGHFAELIWAKIRFINEKPADPGLLTYYQRIMWVPSLHSATWGLTKWLFPFTLWFVLLVAVFAWFDTRKRPDPLVRFFILFFSVSLIAFILFVRFHVMVALGTAVLTGWAVGRSNKAGTAWLAVTGFVVVLAVMAEAGHSVRERERMGRPNVYYEEMKELADWLRVEIAPEPVLANMGVSAYIAAYAKCPVAIHPKFEDPSIRARVRQFGEIMFGADEKALRDWMDELDLTHLVYAKGEFASISPEYQMRYFVNKMDPPETVPARRFEREDETLRYFTRLWGNRKYVVYESLSRVHEAEAADQAAVAQAALQQGRLRVAEALAVEALKLDRHQQDALRVVRHVGSLLEQGFRDVDENE